jgi:hypothetical protein
MGRLEAVGINVVGAQGILQGGEALLKLAPGRLRLVAGARPARRLTSARVLPILTGS